MNELYTYSNTSKPTGDKLQKLINDDHFDVSHTEFQPSQKAIDFILSYSKALDVQKTSNFDCYIVAN